MFNDYVNKEIDRFTYVNKDKDIKIHVKYK